MSRCCNVNDWFSSGRTLKNTATIQLLWKVVWVGGNSLKVFCNENDMSHNTASSCARIWGQSSCSGQRCFSFETCCAGPGPLLAAERHLLKWEPVPINTLPGKGLPGKSGYVWGRAKVLLKAVHWGSKEYWGKQGVQSQLLQCINTEKWSQSSKVGSVVWGLQLEDPGGSWGWDKGNFLALLTLQR